MCTYMTSSPNISRNCSNRQRYLSSRITDCFSFNMYQRLTPNFFTNVEYFDLKKKKEEKSSLHVPYMYTVQAWNQIAPRPSVSRKSIVTSLLISTHKKIMKIDVTNTGKNWYLARIGPRPDVFFFILKKNTTSYTA